MAVRWGYLGHNPADPIKTLKENSEIPNALTEPQLEKLLAELPKHARILTIFAADTGMRSSEIRQLQWRDVRFEEKMMVVCGAGSKNDEFRVIPMTEKVYHLLQSLSENHPSPNDNSSNVFPWKNISTALHNAGVRAGIGHVHPHMLRHTFATRLRDKGVPLDRIKELLGHKSMQMVLRYAKARPQQLEEAIAALNG